MDTVIVPSQSPPYGFHQDVYVRLCHALPSRIPLTLSGGIVQIMPCEGVRTGRVD